jgi:ParB family chromosome partitioning protein
MKTVLQTEQPVLNLAELKYVLLSEIEPDPNQPRKYYDEKEMDELTASVREKGVLQPITIRKNPGTGKPYMLVCGERRYRAALSVNTAFKTRNTIPVSIQELTDDEALQLQIIENLQRKDVHPMEEAVAFKSLMDNGMDVKEVAAKVGKNEYYVRQRAKLNGLAKTWQDAYYANRISSSLAITLCTFDEKTQNEIWKNDGSHYSGRIDLSNYVINKYRGDLLRASFDLSDATLDKKMGACNSCPFNSAVASLFPEAAANPICSNRQCFKHKSDINFDRKLKDALADPEVILINPEYYSSEDNLTRKLEKEGLKILNGQSKGNFSVIEVPEEVNLETYDEDDYDSREELIADYEKDKEKYEKELAAYDEKVKGGKYKKAFAINGDGKGTYMYIVLGKGSGSSAKSVKEKASEDKLTVEDIDGEIKRINEREKRNKELDVNKIHKETLTQLSKKKSSVISMKHQGMADRAILVYILLHETNGIYNLKQKSGVKGLPAEPGYHAAYSSEYFKALGKITDDQLAQIVRVIAFDKWGNPAIAGDVRKQDTALRMIAEYAGIDIKKIEDDQQVEAATRQERVKKRIAALNKQKSELKKPSAEKSKVKKAAKKK